MKPAKISVLYNETYGYIIASETKVQNQIYNTVVNPVITKKSRLSAKELGKTILEGLDVSRLALPVKETEKDGFFYWHVSGIKSFATFSRKFDNIKVTQEENYIVFQKMGHAKTGGYLIDKSKKPLKCLNNASPEELGNVAFQLFGLDETVNINDKAEFMTVNESKITYWRSLDDFTDIGDGHTDAYQIYTYEGKDDQYIAFLIDNGYTEFSKRAIKKRWQQIYGRLNVFEYKEVNEEQLKICVHGEAGSKLINSNIYRDGEGMLEVLTQIDKAELSTGEQSKIQEKFQKVLDSIVVKA